MSESVAATAGVQAGDVLMAIDGEPVDDVGTLHRMVMAIDTGATFQLDVRARVRLRRATLGRDTATGTYDAKLSWMEPSISSRSTTNWAGQDRWPI